MGFLVYIGSFFSFISSCLRTMRENKIRKEGRIEAEKEISQNTIEEIQKREEIVNEEPKTSYNGDPSLIIEWLRKHNEGKK